MKTKWVIMQELEDTDMPVPYLIVDSEERAEQLSYELESRNTGYIFYPMVCEEEEK